MEITETKNLKKVSFKANIYKEFLEILDEDEILEEGRPHIFLNTEEMAFANYVEDYDFPSFIKTFKKLKQKRGWVVPKEIFINHYLEDNDLRTKWKQAARLKYPTLEVSEVMVDVIYDSYLSYRLGRAYVSFIYEIIYKLYFASTFENVSVISHTFLDYYKGYDMTIKKGGRVFYVHITKESAKSRAVIEKKKLRGNNRNFQNHFYLFYDKDYLDVNTYDNDFVLLSAILNYLDTENYDISELENYEIYTKESQLYKDLSELADKGYSDNEKVEVLTCS